MADSCPVMMEILAAVLGIRQLFIASARSLILMAAEKEEGYGGFYNLG